MTNFNSLHPVHTATDAAEGEAIRQALIEAGIDVEVLLTQTLNDQWAMEILVPAGQIDAAEAIIRSRSWPRLV